ncbi:unnamed protein product [Coccothraustes coccothraustes]
MRGKRPQEKCGGGRREAWHMAKGPGDASKEENFPHFSNTTQRPLSAANTSPIICVDMGPTQAPLQDHALKKIHQRSDPQSAQRRGKFRLIVQGLTGKWDTNRTEIQGPSNGHQ